MRRRDSLVDSHVEVCESRGLVEATVKGRRAELECLGCWLKRRRASLSREEVDVQVLFAYLKWRTHFHSKSTLACDQPCAVFRGELGAPRSLGEVIGCGGSKVRGWIGMGRCHGGLERSIGAN